MPILLFGAVHGGPAHGLSFLLAMLDQGLFDQGEVIYVWRLKHLRLVLLLIVVTVVLKDHVLLLVICQRITIGLGEVGVATVVASNCGTHDEVHTSLLMRRHNPIAPTGHGWIVLIMLLDHLLRYVLVMLLLHWISLLLLIHLLNLLLLWIVLLLHDHLLMLTVIDHR